MPDRVKLESVRKSALITSPRICRYGLVWFENYFGLSMVSPVLSPLFELFRNNVVFSVLSICFPQLLRNGRKTCTRSKVGIERPASGCFVQRATRCALGGRNSQVLGAHRLNSGASCPMLPNSWADVAQ